MGKTPFKLDVKMNRVETTLINNPIRSALQRRYEARLLEGLGGKAEGEHVLEVGCGRGIGTKIILDRFRAQHVDAFDLDPHMVGLAQRRVSSHPSSRVRVWEGDVTAIDAPDGIYDAVFDFAIIHHVPKWREALDEVVRVLKPGGRFYFEEVTKHALDRWSYRTFLDHPANDRFHADEFIAELETKGIRVGGNYVTRFFSDFVIGVGSRQDSYRAGIGKSVTSLRFGPDSMLTGAYVDLGHSLFRVATL